MLFFQHVAQMLSVGIALKDSLASFQAKDPRTVKKISKGIDRGLSFCEALRSAEFPPHVCSTIDAGEKGGALEDALKSIADFTEDDLKFRSAVTKTLFMPTFNILVVVFVVFFLSSQTLPKLEGVLVNLGNIPDFSKKVFAVARFIKTNMAAIIAMGAIGIGSLVWWLRTKPPFLVKVPIVGMIIRYSFIVGLFNRLVLIHKAGVSLHDALKIVEATETGIFKITLRNGIKKVDRGKQLYEIFDDPFYPPQLCQMVRTATDSGKVDLTFQRIAEIYRRTLVSSSDRIAQVLEPLSLVLVGAVVTVVMLSVLYPIMSASSTVGK